MPEGATHKGRERWMRWSGTPERIASVAREVEAQVLAGDPGPSNITISVIAPAWESDFTTPEDFEGGLDDEDVSDIDSLEISSSMLGRKITVSFTRPPKGQGNQAPLPPVGLLNVAGPDRDWVRDATEAVKQAIQPGVPKSARFFRWALLSSVPITLLGFVLLIAGGPKNADSPGLSTAGWVVLLTGLGLLLLSVLPGSVLPRLEILPEGKQTRRSKVLRWGQREVGWWVRNLLLLLAGGVLTLLLQKLA
jgi:hypothetical protein